MVEGVQVQGGIIMSELGPTLTGLFWYTKRQFSDIRKTGQRPKTYCYIYDTKKVVEYTEFVTDEMLRDDPSERCFYEDAQYLGYGYFFNWGDIV